MDNFNKYAPPDITECFGDEFIYEFPGVGFRPAKFVMQRDQYGDYCVITFAPDEPYNGKYEGKYDAYAHVQVSDYVEEALQTVAAPSKPVLHYTSVPPTGWTRPPFSNTPFIPIIPGDTDNPDKPDGPDNPEPPFCPGNPYCPEPPPPEECVINCPNPEPPNPAPVPLPAGSELMVTAVLAFALFRKMHKRKA